MRHLSTSLCILCLCTTLHGAVTYVATASRDDVQTAINAAADGDTLFVPAGNVTWASGIFVTNNISLIGAGTNQTVVSCSGAAVTRLGTARAGIARLSGFRFIGLGPSHGIVIAADPVCRVRVDHCSIEHFNFAFYSYGVGVVDHCNIFQCARVARTSCPDVSANPSNADEMYPINNWIPMDMGTSNAMFYETLSCTWTNFNNSSNILFTAQDAGGYIVRNSTFDMTFAGTTQQWFDFHGNQGNPPSTTGMRGTYALGVYGNTFNCSGAVPNLQFALIRAGSGLICSNTINGSLLSNSIQLFEEEATGRWGVTGPPYYDQITNLWIWANPGVNVGYYDAETAAIYGAGVYWTNIAPNPVVTLAYPHPIVIAQDYVDRRTVGQLTVGTLRGAP